MAELASGSLKKVLGKEYLRRFDSSLQRLLELDDAEKHAAEFMSFVLEPDFYKAIGKGLRLDDRFSRFPPLYFYRGLRYLEAGELDYAREQFLLAERLVNLREDVCRCQDNESALKAIDYFIVLNAGALLLSMPADQVGERLRLLGIISEKATAGDWRSRMLAALHYHDLGQSSRARDILTACSGAGATHCRNLLARIGDENLVSTLLADIAVPGGPGLPLPDDMSLAQDAETLYQLGEMHLNLNHARDFYMRAAEKGHLLAYASLALISPHQYLDRIPSILEALEARAAQSYEAAALAADFYLDTDGVPTDIGKAKDLLKAGVRAGDGKSIAMLGVCCLHGDTEDDRIRGYECLKTAWESGELTSGYFFALCLLTGVGCKPDIETGLGIMFEQARKGSPAALLAIGNMAWKGEIIPRDELLAFNCFSQAANQGNPVALQGLGYSYLNGIAVEKNPKMAFEMFSAAAARQFDPATFEMAACLGSGIGIEKDAEKAVKILMELVEKGYVPAHTLLGKYYQTGNGVDADPGQARELFAIAANAGDEEARRLLSDMDTH